MIPPQTRCRGRKHVKSLVFAMKTFSSTQLGPDRVLTVSTILPRVGIVKDSLCGLPPS